MNSHPFHHVFTFVYRTSLQGLSVRAHACSLCRVVHDGQGLLDDGGRTSNPVAKIKMTGVIKTIGDRPAVIIDDDFEFLERDWAVQRTEDGTPTLVVRPNYEEGLTREHVDLAMAFATKLSEGQQSVPSSAGRS